MASWDDSTPGPESDGSRETSPDYESEPSSKTLSPDHMSGAEAQSSTFLRLPVDIFKCVTDHLDRDAAWSLKRLCRGLSRSKIVDEILYKYPIQFNDVRDIRLADWKYRTIGAQRWHSFQKSINDTNRHHVQRISMSHWNSVADFKWIEENLPNLVALELTAIKDFVWTPEEIWTWKELADTCPKLFERIEELEVPNWADYNAHSRIEYSYSYNDYRFKQKFRLSRRRDGGSVAKMIFPLCTKLKTLAIRERYSGFHTWNEWEVHQRVCCLVDGIEKNCGPSLKKVKVYDYAPCRSLFATDASTWPNLTDIEIGLYSWMEERRDRDMISPIPYRITPGNHHRDEEEAFDDKTFDTCERSHMDLGQDVVQGHSATFEELLQNLRTITRKYPHIRVKPLEMLRDIVLHPFHLVNVTHRSRHHHNLPLQHIHQQQLNGTDNSLADPVANQDIQDAIRWLRDKCDWKPILAWDSMMCDVFPANLELSRAFLPKSDVMSRIQTMITTLRSLNIPIRLSIGDRANTCPNSGLDGSLYFGDYKCFIGEGDEKREVLAPTQARFNLTLIAPLVDDLSILYPVDVPGVSGWRASKRPTDGEKILLEREKVGWQRFFMRYALLFKNLKKLSVTVPSEIYNDWGKSAPLRELLNDSKWEVLESDGKLPYDYSVFGSYLPFNHLRYSIARKRPRMRFVQRVFFRQDDSELPLNLPPMTDAQREEDEISAEVITAPNDLPPHRFWPDKPLKVEDEPKPKKRKHENNEDATQIPAKKMKRHRRR